MFVFHNSVRFCQQIPSLDYHLCGVDNFSIWLNSIGEITHIQTHTQVESVLVRKKSINRNWAQRKASIFKPTEEKLYYNDMHVTHAISGKAVRRFNAKNNSFNVKKNKFTEWDALLSLEYVYAVVSSFQFALCFFSFFTSLATIVLMIEIMIRNVWALRRSHKV